MCLTLHYYIWHRKFHLQLLGKQFFYIGIYVSHSNDQNVNIFSHILISVFSSSSVNLHRSIMPYYVRYVAYATITSFTVAQLTADFIYWLYWCFRLSYHYLIFPYQDVFAFSRFYLLFVVVSFVLSSKTYIMVIIKLIFYLTSVGWVKLVPNRPIVNII